MNEKEILEKYPWLTKKNQKLIISPDSDGFLSALLYLNYFDAEVVGFYDGKIMVCPEDIDPRDCLFLDMDVYCKDIKSVGHHMVCYNKNRKPANWYNYDNCVQLNNLRDFDRYNDFSRKFPLATIHFLLALLSKANEDIKLSDTAIVPLLFSDGVWTVLFGYTENCLDWFDWLHINDKDSILYDVFCGENSFYNVMLEINTFLRERDKLNSNVVYNMQTLEKEPKSGKRTGDKLLISNSNGDAINLEKHSSGLYNIIDEEKDRVQKFIELLATLMGWDAKLDKWNFKDFTIRKFTKSALDGNGGHGRLNQANYNAMAENHCFSMAITSGQTVEYTIDSEGYFN